MSEESLLPSVSYLNAQLIALRKERDELAEVARTLIQIPGATAEEVNQVVRNVLSMPRFMEPVEVKVSALGVDSKERWVTQLVQDVWRHRPSEGLVGFTTREGWNCHASEEGDRWKRVLKTPVCGAERLVSEQRLDVLLRRLAMVANAYDDNGLDEVRPARGLGLEHDLDVALVSGRGGRCLLTLADFVEARAILRALREAGR